jgi:hypothetical protein
MLHQSRFRCWGCCLDITSWGKNNLLYALQQTYFSAVRIPGAFPCIRTARNDVLAEVESKALNVANFVSTPPPIVPLGRKQLDDEKQSCHHFVTSDMVGQEASMIGGMRTISLRLRLTVFGSNHYRVHILQCLHHAIHCRCTKL